MNSECPCLCKQVNQLEPDSDSLLDHLRSLQGSPLSLSRSSSREGIGNGSDSDNWRERNGTGNGLPGHGDFSSAVSSPKRKQNKSGR